MLSGHFLSNIDVSLEKQSGSVKVYKDAFIPDLKGLFSLVLDSSDAHYHPVGFHRSILRDHADEHRPLNTKKKTTTSLVKKDKQVEKGHRRYCERSWIRIIYMC